MKTPFWEEKSIRPVIDDNQAVLSYEIYHKPENPSEEETIRALNDLVREGKAKAFIRQDYVWYVKK